MPKSRSRILGEGGWVEAYVGSPTGLEVEILDIPEWATEIVVITEDITSDADTNQLVVQLGTSSAYKITGYSGQYSYGTTAGATPSEGLCISIWGNAATTASGRVSLIKTLNDIWRATGLSAASSSVSTEIALVESGGDLGGLLTRFKLVWDMGANFDGGNLTVLYR